MYTVGRKFTSTFWLRSPEAHVRYCLRTEDKKNTKRTLACRSSPAETQQQQMQLHGHAGVGELATESCLEPAQPRFSSAYCKHVLVPSTKALILAIDVSSLE